MAIDKNKKIKIPLIGQLALKNHLITSEALQKALVYCSDSSNKDIALKDYFLSKKLISSRNVERLAKAAQTFGFRQKEFKFGEIAIRKGFINKSVLTLALEEQQNEIKNRSVFNHIGEILVNAGFLTEKQRDSILKLQKRFRKERTKEFKEKDQKVGKTVEWQDKNFLLEPEIITGGIELQVSKDFMMAFLIKTDSFDENISVEEINEALSDKGIVFGVVADEMMHDFIRSSKFKTKFFKVSQGIPPIHGEDARVEFFLTQIIFKPEI
ncbi:MAG: flagellar assembly protein A [Thermodesulfobacteriota bacterium]